MGSLGIVSSNSRVNDRKIALEITSKGGSPAATTYSEEAECDEMHRFSRKLEKI
jgi:hypothetical protein